jgi:branched-chain amino acid transport system substrate-binding protein
MRKKFLTFAVAALFAAGALTAGCGGGAKKEAAKAEDNEIRVGINFELTGGVANYGRQCLEGIQLAVKEVNDAGGLLGGKKIRLIIADNKSEPAESTNAITKLIRQDKVSAVIGPATSSATLATVQVANDNKVPVISPSATNERVTFDNGQTRPFIFRGCFIDPFQGTIMANFAQKTLGAKTAVIYIDNSSDYSKGLAKAFEELFVKNGGKILSQEAYLQRDQDFKSTLTKIKSLNPDVIFLPGYYEEVSKILRQARELDIHTPVLGGDGWGNPELVEMAGKAALNNAYFSDHFSLQDNDPNVIKFIEAMKKEYNKEPSGFNALGYDTARLLIEAIKRANSSDPQKIRDALAQTKGLALATSTVTIDERHNPIKSAVIIELKDGQQLFKEKINP